MRSHFLHIALIVFILLAGWGCKHEVADLQIDYRYFPDSIGRFVEYQITEIEIDNSDTLVYDSYLLKEIVESKFFDSEGRETMRIERYRKNSLSDQYIINDVWTANVLKGSAQKTEENVRFIKLVFPVALYKSWNGNAYNNLPAEIYEITQMDEPLNLNDQSFENVLTVTQADDESIIHKTYKVEKYAQEVGLIYKEIVEVESQATTGEPIMERIEKGIIYTQEAIGYGFE